MALGLLRACSILALATTATPAFGQSFNIDCAGHLAIPPDSSYGAGASQPGYWNPQFTGNLRDLDGNLTEAMTGTSGGSTAHEIPGATGDDERLMESVFEMLPSASVSVTNLAAGHYDLYAYSWGGQIFGPRTVGFTVFTGNTYGGSLSFGPQWPGGQVEGVTFARIPIEVLPGLNFLTLRIGGGGPKTFNVLAGIQLVWIPAPGVLLVSFSAGLLALRRRR
jgi:hypothetical protein